MTVLKATLPNLKLIYIIMASNKGFSLIETIIALGLGMITMAMVMGIFAQGLLYIRTMKNNQVLNASATDFINTADYWIKQGQNFDASIPGQLKITLPGGTTHTIDKSLLEVNGISATTTFIKMTRSVRINLFVQRGSDTLSATTALAQRSF